MPDFSYCDFAISFCRHFDDNPRHIRIPNWVQRLYQYGYAPTDLLQQNRHIPDKRDRFAAFVFNRKVPIRETFFKSLSRVGQVDAPSQSMNNYPAIGHAPRDKILFLSKYRFSVAFENASTPGYTTEKIVEAFQAGTIPIYWGDSLVGLDFNSHAFLNLDNFNSHEEFSEAAAVLDKDPARLRSMLAELVYVNDQIPTCADNECIFASFESIFG